MGIIKLATMIDLFHTLQNVDIGSLKMIAGIWGIEIPSDTQSAIPALVKTMQDPRLLEEMIASLPQEVVSALQGLLENDGFLSWSLFCTRYGEFRSMGPSKRDRERPDLYPVSATEILWYRALIGKAFLDLDSTPQEYAYIPEDLVPNLISLYPEEVKIPGRPASPKERARPVPVNDHILDDICTFLAAMRIGLNLDALAVAFLDIPIIFLRELVQAAGIIEDDTNLNPETARIFLESERGPALAKLAETWLHSAELNELHMLPQLQFEGTWQNQPLETRRKILEFISQVPVGEWWSLSAFIDSIEEQFPDFQRPAGDYDSWFILDKASGQYLRGRTSWQQVDGALLRFMICAPLHWLGFLDLAMRAESTEPSAFRISKWSEKLWHGSAPDDLAAEDASISVTPDGRLRLMNLTPRTARYQIARFGEWDTKNDREFIYRLTPQSLQNAAGQGLRINHLIALLRKHVSGGIPPTLLKALERWERGGTQAHINIATLLHVEKPEMLTALMNTPAKRYLGSSLNETTITVNKGGEAAVREVLLKLGYLSETD